MSRFSFLKKILADPSFDGRNDSNLTQLETYLNPLWDMTTITPLTGASVAVPAATGTLLVKPAGTIAALTLVIADGTYQGQELWIVSTQIVTTLTVTGNFLIATAALAVGSKLRYKWDVTLAKWV